MCGSQKRLLRTRSGDAAVISALVLEWGSLSTSLRVLGKVCASHQRHLSLRPLSHCGAIASVTSATSPGADHDKPRHRVVRRSTARFSMARPRLGRCTDRCGRRAWHSDAEHGEQTKTNPSAVTVRLDRVCSRTTRRLANHALRLRMLRRQKPLDDFAHACFIFARREHVLHPSIGLAGPTAGGSPDVVLCPALAPFIADRLRGVLRC